MASDPKTLSETKTYCLKAGDRRPALNIPLFNEDGTVKDLTGVTTVELVVAPCVSGRRLIDRKSMSISGTESQGIVEYLWTGSELVSGEYIMEIILDYGLSTQESFPKGSYYKLVIVPHL